MRQRNQKLACLCIATALFAVSGAVTAEAAESKGQKEKREEGALHIGAPAAILGAWEQGAQRALEEASEEEAKEEEKELAVARVDSYVHVRNQPGLEGEVIGKLHNNSVGEIVGEEGEWLRIASGSVEGYIKAEFALRGEEGAAKAEEVGERRARVEADALRVREEASTESEILELLPQSEEILVDEESEDWIKVASEETEGYVSADYVEVYTVYPVAESKEEEAARLRLEEERRRAAEEAASAAAGQREPQAVAQASPQAAPSAQGGIGAGQADGWREEPSAGKGDVKKPSAAVGLGDEIASYALLFVGNPYVYGGTSLTDGADCSGFVMSVFAHFGISLPRTSGEQGQCGTDAGGIGNARPGDLISYSGHIGIYIGNGKIVHASTEATGIKVSNASYRPIRSVRRIVPS